MRALVLPNTKMMKFAGRPDVPDEFHLPTLAEYAHCVVPGGSFEASSVFPVSGKQTISINDSSSTGNGKRGSIYLGPKESCDNTPGRYEELQKHNIGAIVNCTPNCPNTYEFSAQSQLPSSPSMINSSVGLKAGGGHTIEYCRVPVNDEMHANLLLYMKGVTAFMESYLSAGKSVLVHCEMGRSRSASVVIAHQIAYGNITRDEAYIRIKAIRQAVNPNMGFWTQLQEFEKECHSTGTGTGTGTGSGTGTDTDTDTGTGTGTNKLIYDQDWVKASVATFNTCSAATKFHLMSTVVESLNPEDIPDLLENALDYIYGENVREFDLMWFRTLVHALVGSQIHSQHPLTTSEVITSHVHALLAKDGEWFSDKWCGEYNAGKVQKILQTLAFE